MFTDIVGYTALMGNDEKKAFEILKKNRQIQQPLVKQYKGSWIKELGDGVLASFNTVTDAVMCAGAMHQACKNVEGLQLRIGIHLGEVVFENNDVFGDGVNIASRLQALAPIGGTYVSESIYKNVSNKKEIFTEFIREENLKNVSESVRIYEIKLIGTLNFDADAVEIQKKENIKKAATKRKGIFAISAILILAVALSGYFFIYKKQKPASNNIDVLEKSIAVLPFVNMSSDPQQEYFSDGLSEELINMFTTLRGLRVIGRTSSFAFKGKNEDLRSIGKKLNVEYLLEGSVRKSENLLRITAQLIKTSDGSHIWSSTFEKEMSNIFEIQDQISSSVTEALKVTLLSDNINRQKNINPEAYNDFLKGRFYYENSADRKNTERAAIQFKYAIAKDSAFALPWTYLSMCYWRASKSSRDSFFTKAKSAAIKAVQLDPSSGIAAVNMAEIFDNEFDFKKALEKIEIALKLNPEDPYVLRNAGRFYTLLGRRDESIDLCKKALDKDPIQITALTYLGGSYYFARQYEELNQYHLKSAELNSNGLNNEYFNALMFNNQFDKAKAEMEKEPTEIYKLKKSVIYYYKTGNKSESDKYISQLLAMNIERPYLLATIYAWGNEADKTMEWLEKAYQFMDKELVYVKVEPVFDFLKKDNRFLEFIKRMDFPE